jgi:hypothetical protein
MVVEARQPKSRRAIIAAGAAALAASVAQALGRPSEVRAGIDGDVVLGNYNASSGTTSIDCSVGTAFQASATGIATGVQAFSPNGSGVYGTSYGGSGVFGYTPGGTNTRGVSGVAYGDGTGVVGTSSTTPGSASGPGKTGVFGYSVQDSSARGVVGQAGTGTGVHGWAGSGSMPAPSTKTGVYGRCDTDANARGVSGSSGQGTGVYASTSTGAALLGLANSTGGFGLKSTGRVSLSKASGVATIAAGTSVTVTPGIDIVAGTYVLLTPQADPGTRRIWATTSTTANTITIHVSSAVSGSLKVAWLALG